MKQAAHLGHVCSCMCGRILCLVPQVLHISSGSGKALRQSIMFAARFGHLLIGGALHRVFAVRHLLLELFKVRQAGLQGVRCL